MKYLVALLIAAAMLAGCGSTMSSPSHIAQPAPSAQSEAVGTRYPLAVQHNFMIACEHNSPTLKCLCLLGKVEAAYSLAQFQELEARVAEGASLPPELRRAEAACES